MKGKFSMRLVLILLVLTWSAPAFAEEKPADSRQYLVEKIRADKKLLVAENMELTETEAEKFWPVYEQYQDELFLLRARTLKLINDYGEALGKMSNEAAKKLLDDFMDIKALDLTLRQAYLPKFRSVLSDVKVVRYYQIENKIEAALAYELGAKIPLIEEE